MNGRPLANEAPPYYFTYINQACDDDANIMLENQLRELTKLFSGISEETSLHRYGAGKWSVRQVLSHIADSERTFLFRAFWFARGFETSLPSYDQNVAAAHANADLTKWAAHLEEFQRIRLSTVAFFRNLPPDAWARSGIASDSRFTVRALAFIIVGHATHHAAILRQRYL